MKKYNAIPLAGLFFLALFLMIACSGTTVYYVSNDGDDSNTGTSDSRPWKSIDKVSSYDFAPGDLILFRGGDTFDGTVILGHEDSGTPGTRIYLGSYGEDQATIYGGDGRSIWADSCRYLTVEDLELVGSGRKSGNTSDGLLAQHCDGIIIRQVDAHGFQKSGIHVRQSHNAVIEHVYAHENGFAGIHVTGNTMWDPEKYDNHDLYIAHCVAENNPGDPTALNNHSGNGILASSVKRGVIEYCEAFNNGWDMPWTGNGPVGIWIWDATEVVIQYCIAHHNRTNPVAADGGGFDFDGGVSNSVIQYCIAHNNEGAGFGLYEFGAAKPWENNTVRYNISQDDGIINGGSVGIWKNEEGGVMRNCQVYNNTFYNSQENGSNIWLYDHYPGYQFRNNVFIYNGSMIDEGKSPSEELFQGNLYWNLAGDASIFGYSSLQAWAEATGNEMQGDVFTGLYQDPIFRDPGTLELTDPDKISTETLDGYFPKEGSPLIDRGLDIEAQFGVDPGERDLPGTSVPVNEKYDIGAIELIDQ